MSFLPSMRTFCIPLKYTGKYVKNFSIPVRNLVSKQLVYSEFGDPLHVIKIRECEVPQLQPQDVLVRMLAAPVNPADINTIQGKYPVKVNFPSVPGNEGVGIVEDVGVEVKDMKKCDRVIVTKPLQGTWRNYAVIKEESLFVVPDHLGVVELATLSVNPCTAYRLLHDFVDLNIDSVVIQNGGNSACGQYITQLCKAWNIRNVSVVRDRPNIGELKEYLKSLGASEVLTEDEISKTRMFRDGFVAKPSLALNCVGGKSSLEMLRQLSHSGKMVTYGGMSRDPVCVPTSAFIFKNISCHGFWMTAWNETAEPEKKRKMMCDLIALMHTGQLKAPAHKMVKFDEYKEAVVNALRPKGFTGCKYVLDFC